MMFSTFNTTTLVNSTELTNDSFNFENERFGWYMWVRNSISFILGNVAFFGSALIILIILRYPSLRKKEDCIHIIGFLAFSDGITGIGTVMGAVNHFRIELFKVTKFTRGGCMCIFVLIVFGTFLSQVMIAVIGIDRLIAVRDPMKYRTRNHFKFAALSFLATTLFSLVSTGAMFTGDLSAQPAECSLAATTTKLYMKYCGGFSVLIGLIVIVTYGRMLVTLKRKMKGLKAGRSAVAMQLQRQAKVNKTISLILGLYCAFWVSPTFVFGFVQGVGRSSKAFEAIIIPIIGIGIASSAACNIFVYSLKMPSFKVYLKKFFKMEKDSAIMPIAISGMRQSNFPASRYHPMHRNFAIRNVTRVPRHRIRQNLELKNVTEM